MVRSKNFRQALSQRLAVIAGGVTVSLVIAGCGGSALDPNEVLAANRAIQGQAAAAPGGALVPGNGGQGPAAVPGQPVGSTGSGPGGGGSAQSPGQAGSGGSVSGGSAGGGAPSGGAAAAGVKAGACGGFKNTTGITDSTITLGNSSDISGPVPGLFAAAQEATKAYVAFFNATNPRGICGRKLALETFDSRTDAGADQSGYTKMCDSVFASVGSMSAFDSGGASTAQGCGLPDLRTAAVTNARNLCSTCFGAQATGVSEYTNAVYDFWIKQKKAATGKAAYLYLNAGAAAENAKTQIAVGQKRGMNWVYTAPIDVADFNYGPYVQQMKSRGVQFVQFLGAYQQSARLAQAMQQAGFKPEVLFYDPSIYQPEFLEIAGGAAEGAYMFTAFTPFSESQPELNLYKQWLQQVAPGAEPTFFGLFAWSSAKLFVEKALALGGRLSRPALIGEVRSVRAWTGGGMHSPMDVGGKHAPSCARFFQIKNKTFVPFGSTKYLCNGYSRG